MAWAISNRSESVDAEQFVLLERMAHGATLAELLESIVTLVERQSRGMLCSILLFDAAERRLRHGAAPSLPPEYNRAVDGLAIGPEAGSCGTAAYSRQPVIVADIATHPYWREYKHLALPHGLIACWSSPILSSEGEVLGTFAMYFRETRSPSEAELRWVKAATHVAAVSIGRHRLMQMLESAELRARQLARLYAVSSSVAEAIVRLRDPHELYEQACRIAVEHRLARLAWVGLYDAGADRLVPVARCGEDRGYIDAITLSLRDGSNNRGPAARAMRTGACALSNDLANDADFFWRDDALARGLRACAAFPLNVNGRTIGILAMYADRADYFGAAEQKVLGGLADNIAFAVASAQAERERQDLLRALRERVKELTLLHSVARLLPGRGLDAALLREIVAAIPSGWQFPAACAARIRWNGLEASTPNWRDVDRALRAPIAAGGNVGSLEVAYVDDGSATFLEEERHVLQSIADMLSTYFGFQITAIESRRSDERLKAVIEHTPNVGIQWYDADGRLLFCNRASESLFGWSAEHAKGKTLDQLNFPLAEAERLTAAIREVSATGLPFGPVEFNYDRPDGARGTLLSTIFRIPYGDDEHCYVCMDVDLTEHKRMAENVRAAEKVRAAILNSVADGIFYLAVEPHRQFRFVAVNQAYLTATGLVESDVIGRAAIEVLPEASRRQALAMFAQAIENERPVSWQEAASYPSGLRHGEVTVAPIFGPDGRCTHLVGTIHDITQLRQAAEQRRSLEAELQKAQRLEALGTLAGGVAHDFNNILTAIAGNAALGLKGDSTEAQRSLAEIRNAAQRASSLVRQLLTFGRAEPLQRRAIDVHAVIEEAVGLLRATLPSGVELRTALNDTTPAAHADASQLHQIVMNLATNAVQALGARGTIDILADGVDLVDAAPDVAQGRYVRVRVRDTGCGMSAATVQKIFEPFFTTKSPGQGTGLGLSVVHGIVKAHGGTIRVTSDVGRGTEFEVLLPAAAARQPAAPAAAHSGQVLYVDDDQALGYLVARLLERIGHPVTVCTDPVEALRRFREQPEAFVAVITDVSMAGMSGVDLARELRNLRPAVPIVITSGYLRDEVLAAAKALRAEVILKPNTVDELGATLHRLLSSSSVAGAA